MENMKTKIVCDLVHGYIKLDPNTERVINHESFQRLKHINQMTANYLYPSANHTRFEHSLGVMKLSIDFFYRIKHQFRSIIEFSSEDEIKDKIQYLFSHLKYAALLHDIGHSPLSHVGEKFYNLVEIKDEIKSELAKQKIEVTHFDDFKMGSNHEWMSCYVIIKNFYDLLANIFHEEGVVIDIEFIIRIITGNMYEDHRLFDYPERDIIISIINSKTIDVDKLDYLMRDNFMTGKVGPTIDVVRLLESLTITQSKRLSFSKVGLSTIQKIIECRDSIYLWVCNHHTVVYTDYLLMECIKHMIKLNEIVNPPKYINTKRLLDKKEIILQFYENKGGVYKLKKLSKEQEGQLMSILYQISYLPYREAIDRNDYFSTKAIAKRNVTDHEIYALMRKAKLYGEKNLSSTYMITITDQLLNRNFLKPIWKTIFEYKKFINENFSSDTRKDIINFIVNDRDGENNRKKIVRLMCDETGCKLGEIFLIVRLNKFYFTTDLDQFYIYMKDKTGNEKNESLSDLLPQKDYRSLYSEIAFYLYCKKDKIEEVTNSFISIMQDYRRIDKKHTEIFE
jgi:HD superfamily phosphohydrolase